MNTKLSSLWLFVFLATVQAAHANPFLIAWKIQARPEAFELGVIDEMAEAIIEGAEEIEEITVTTGDPSLELNILVVQPKDYGFDVSGTIGEGKNGKAKFNFSVQPASKKLTSEDFIRALSPERQQQYRDEEELSLTAEEGLEVVKLTAREGGAEVQARSKTIFLLNGYGVPNRAALPWALILAKNGYQVVVPDLPGFGRSGGKGPTFGKREAQDLIELLTELQAEEKIGRTESVGVMGISYGAGMAALWTARDPRVTATVLIAPYARADETLTSAAEVLKEQLNLPFAVRAESVRQGTALAAKMLAISWEEVSPAKAIPSIQNPILFITSPSDEIIPAAVVEKLHQSARKGSQLRSIDVPHFVLGMYLDELEPDVLGYFEQMLP